jgi:hypothetical protein
MFVIDFLRSLIAILDTDGGHIALFCFGMWYGNHTGDMELQAAAMGALILKLRPTSIITRAGDVPPPVNPTSPTP